MPGSWPAEFCGARFLLRAGRAYQEAVDRFAPYDRVQDKNDEGRAAGAKLIQEAATSDGKKQAFIYVNNRFEGNAPTTLAEMVELAGLRSGPAEPL
jgi:hypothetical protein